MSWWPGHHYRCMWVWMRNVYVLLLQQLLQHKYTQHLHGRTWGQGAQRAPKPHFWMGYLDAREVQMGISVFSSWESTFTVTVLLTDLARSLKISSGAPVQICANQFWAVSVAPTIDTFSQKSVKKNTRLGAATSCLQSWCSSLIYAGGVVGDVDVSAWLQCECQSHRLNWAQ